MYKFQHSKIGNYYLYYNFNIEGNTDVLFDVCKHIGLSVNIGTVGRHRRMKEEVLVTVGSNYYIKVKIFKYISSLLTN